jgi:hypothetical protein
MSKEKFMDGENTATVCVHHSVNKLCIRLLHTEMYNKIIKLIYKCITKKICCSTADLEAIKHVSIAITTTTNR